LRHCEDELALVYDLERGDATDEAHLWDLGRCDLARYDLGTDHGGRKHDNLLHGNQRQLEAIRGN
jgi:hypothetical protein